MVKLLNGNGWPNNWMIGWWLAHTFVEGVQNIGKEDYAWK